MTTKGEGFDENFRLAIIILASILLGLDLNDAPIFWARAWMHFGVIVYFGMKLFDSKEALTRKRGE